jgi:hypothetical protein
MVATKGDDYFFGKRVGSIVSITDRKTAVHIPIVNLPTSH